LRRYCVDMEGSIGPPGESAQLEFPRLCTVIIGVMKNGLDLLNVSADFQQVMRAVIIVVAVIIDVRKNRQKS